MHGSPQAGRPFDFIIVGGGTFGSAIAEHLWFRQKQAGGGLRTLVVEAGLFTVPEHVQNTGGSRVLPIPQNPFFLNENAPQPEKPQNEVWGSPWKSAIPFKGLAYTLGGRSFFWGGWSPRLLERGDGDLARDHGCRFEREIFRRKLKADRRR